MNSILDIFIENPEKEFHLRELSRILKKSPATISKQLKPSLKQEIIVMKKLSNHNYFRANTEDKKYKQLKLQYNLQKINESGIIELLEEKFNYPEAIILFGSWQKAENNENSDLDILIITPSKKEVNLQQIGGKLKTKIQLFQHSKKEIENLKNKNKQLLNNMINGITIYGFWEIFK
jgi:predicted nucleotidyltransferase